MNDIVIMSPTVNRAVYEWKTFLSRRSVIVKRTNRAGLYVELLNGQKIYFKGETEGPRVLLGLRADIVTVDEFNESEVMKIMNNQNEVMDFPETFEEFAEFYGFKDKDEVYTNGSDLIQVFRVKQWLEHANKYTPVSKGLPKNRDWYLGIFKEPDTGWVNPLPFICDYVGYETNSTTKEYWILRGYTDRDEHIDYYFNLECVAWMPLPQLQKCKKEVEE